MRLNFIKNIDLDIENWQNAVGIQGYGVDWAKYIPVDLDKECVKNYKCIIDYLNNQYYNSGLIDAYIQNLKNLINIKDIQNDLEGLMNYKFSENIEINVLITTFPRMPYNIKNNIFYLCYRDCENGIKKSITNIYHELMHFLFHWNYWGKCQSLGLKENQIHDIKESFTILLNSILIKRNLPIDKGYKIHQKLRERILELWEKNKNLEYVLENIKP